MFTEKENSILEKAEDAILRKFEEGLASEESLTEAQFASLMDGVRVLDRVCVQKQFPPGGYICPWCTGLGRERRNHADISRYQKHEKGRDHTKGGGTGAWL